MTINDFIKKCKKVFGSDIQYKATSKDGRNRNRTYDLLITNELLYRLSYSGVLGWRAHQDSNLGPTA